MLQDRVRTEVKVVLKENEGKLNMSTLQDLLYLERCIKESLRLYPSVPRIARKTEKELKLSKYRITLHESQNNYVSVFTFMIKYY